jgi:hypothetical protein
VTGRRYQSSQTLKTCMADLIEPDDLEALFLMHDLVECAITERFVLQRFIGSKSSTLLAGHREAGTCLHSSCIARECESRPC